MKKLAAVCVSLALIIAWQFPAVSADPPGTADPEVLNLIEKLGSARFAEREQAGRQLEAMGPNVLETLRTAMQHEDSEISGRAGRLVARLEEQILTQKMLTAKKVRLVVRNVSVVDAVSELSRLSGYQLDLAGSREAVNERKITLDTGEVTYWEAFQQLCQNAALTETIAPPPVTVEQLSFRKGGKGGVIQVPYEQPRQLPRTITLTDGKPRRAPVCLQGSVRIQALPGPMPISAGEMQFVIDVSAETRLLEFGAIGIPFFTKIIDDRGQTLSMIEPEIVADADGVNPVRFAGNGNGNINGIMIVNGNVVQLGGSPIPTNPVQRSVPVRIKLGEKEAKTLKEVSGKLTVQALNEPEILVRVKDISGTAGRSFAGKDGHALHMQAVEKREDGSYRISLAVENPGMQMDPFGLRNVRLRGNFNSSLPSGAPTAMPTMIDTDGKEHTAEVISQMTGRTAEGQTVLNAVLDYRPSAEPAQLVLRGQRLVLFSVPFTLKDVPIQ
jgi:hypothetical protein